MLKFEEEFENVEKSWFILKKNNRWPLPIWLIIVPVIDNRISVQITSKESITFGRQQEIVGKDYPNDWNLWSEISPEKVKLTWWSRIFFTLEIWKKGAFEGMKG